MTVKHCHSFIALFWFIATTIGTGQTIGNSTSSQRQMLPWGNVDVSKTQGEMHLLFTLHPDASIIMNDTNPKMPVYSCFIQVSSKATVATKIRRYTAHHPTTNNVHASHLESLAKKVSAPLIQVQGYRWFRGKRLVQLNITPYISGVQGIQEIDTLDVVLQYGVSPNSYASSGSSTVDPQFQALFQKMILNIDDATQASVEQLAWADSTETWIPQNGRTIKVSISTDGVYRLAFANLTSVAPELSQVDPGTFRMFNKGKELPLFISNQTAGVFSSGDYLEFAGQRNYNGASYRHIPVGEEEYQEYLNRYTDTSYYWLTWGGISGKRYSSNDTTIQSVDTLNWYTEKLHIENNGAYGYIGSDQVEQQNPFWTSGDIWYWGWLFANGEFDIAFHTTQFYTMGSTARFYVKVASSAADIGITPTQILKTGLNSFSFPDTTSLNPFQQAIIQRNVPLSEFVIGNNTLRVFSLPTASSTNSVVVDWADVEYPRNLISSNDSLWFGFYDVAGVEARSVIVQGLTTSDVVVYKVQGTPKKIVGCAVSGNGPYSISFVDTIGNSDRYVLMSSSKIQTPPMTFKQSFTNLRNNTRSADYLLITNFGYPGFSSLANSYSAFIHQTYGLNTAVIDVRDIYDEFGYGYPVPESIREFLKATTRWTTPMPSYVFFVGKANYDFKNYMTAASGGTVPNIVPAYGMPVSDQWLAVLDDSLLIPQMYLGRLPALNEGEFQTYFQHIQSYTSTTYDDWNKRYMFFSGGDPSTGETNSYHSVNQQIIRSFVNPAPIGGIVTDFYKTANPQSDYGPYTPQQFANVIDSGAILISYIGHSGTQTWDNNIADISKLQNTRGRYALICDYGCSTAKFAEPNVRSFSELFTLDPNGSAIGYIGNSSDGFTSIAATLPLSFYQTVLIDSIHTIGKAHLLAKIQTMNTYGWQQSAMGRQLMLTNTLIGDPALELAIPTKPNLIVTGSNISSVPAFPSDDDNSLQLQIPYHNYGSVPQDSFQIKVSETYLTSKSDTLFLRQVPLFVDTLTLRYPIRNLPGTHTYDVQLNPLRSLNEIYYSDNTTTYSNVIQSASLRVIYPVPDLYSPANKFVLLNPMKKMPGNAHLEIDTMSLFVSKTSYTAPQGLVTTKFIVPNLEARKYYWQAYIDQSDTIRGYFFHSMDSLTHWTQSLPEQWQNNIYTNTVYDSSSVHLSLSNYSIQIVSSGYLTGKYGAVEINGTNILPSTLSRGINVAHLDTMNFHAIQTQSFDTFGGTSGTDTSYSNALALYLNALPTNSLVAMLVNSDGANSLTTSARNAIAQFGSQYINSLSYRDAWALLGKKGFAIGTAFEKRIPRADTQRVTLDTNFIRPSLFGELLSESFGPVAQWTKATITSNVPQGSTLRTYVLGANAFGTYDTLFVTDTNKTVSLTSIDVKKYSTLRLLEKFWANARGDSPELKNWDVILLPLSDLAINYQCVSSSADSVLEGNPIQIQAQIHNVGEQPVNNVQVLFTLMNNGIRQKDTLFIPVIPADSFSTLSYQLATTGRRGVNTEFIAIDPQQQILEEYKIDNEYSFSLFVRTDTTRPAFDITFDGQRIYDGDYVLPNPTIKIAIYDNSPLSISDPSSVYLAMDRRKVTLGAMPDSLFTSQSGNPKSSVTYHPTLTTGEHTLSVRVMDATGNYSDSAATQIQFRIETDLKLLNVFNYPNPFVSETHFTFILTDYADEVKIKIYTINGRLIQDIQVPPQSNAYYRVYWNGRDHDGDDIANGIYFYKVIAKSNRSATEVIQKLAKVR